VSDGPVTGWAGVRAAPRVAAVLVGAAATLAAACPAPAPGALPPGPCAPVAASPAAGVRSAGLAGEYRLTLAATRGPHAGRSVTGRLRLVAYDRPIQGAGNVLYPLHGSAALALDSVGAMAPGDVGAADPARPGVRVMEWQRTDGAPNAPRPQVTLRFGAGANGPDAGQIEGTHLALFVDSVAPGGFYGRWDSGTPEQRSAGHFCAERVASSR
jgi:hypothetical protein